MGRSLLLMVFWLVMAVASAGMTSKSAKIHQREKPRIAYSLHTL
jgi:hypothetical protein